MAGETIGEGTNPFAHYEWDSNKQLLTIRKHKIDFADAKEIFNALHVKIPSSHPDEERWIAVGKLDGKLIAVVYTTRDKGATCRIITARRANRDEQREYHQALRQGGGET